MTTEECLQRCMRLKKGSYKSYSVRVSLSRGPMVAQRFEFGLGTGDIDLACLKAEIIVRMLIASGMTPRGTLALADWSASS